MATPTTNLNKDVSSLYSTGLKPIIVQGIILRLMKALFARTDNLLSPALREYEWKKNSKETKIHIVPVYNWNIDTLQARPAIVVKRNAWKTRKIGIGDGMRTAVDWDLNNEDNRPLGHPTLRIAVEGSTTVFVISKLAAECELLATEVFIHLVQYAPVIRCEFNFDIFNVAELGGIAKLDESEEYFVIPITIAYAVVDSWKLIKEAPLFKGLIVKNNLEN